MRRTALGYMVWPRKKQGPLGFTVIELVIVMAVIVILGVMVMLFINPIEQSKRIRDANRLADLAKVEHAISNSSQEATSSAELLCHKVNFPCQGSSQSNSQGSDDRGWLKVDLSSQKGAVLGTLPSDPVNDVSLHYTYCSDGKNWEINAVLESEKQRVTMSGDGGNDNTKYEIGSDLTLISPQSGTCNF